MLTRADPSSSTYRMQLKWNSASSRLGPTMPLCISSGEPDEAADNVGFPARRFERKCSGSQGVGGGPCRDRTYDQLIKSQLLYQLS
jgi:hypothetical protein